MTGIDQTFAFWLRVLVGPMTDLGPTPQGIRRVIPILGGTFEGPAIRGDILAGGYDWQLIRSDGVAELEARYLLQTHDGAVITLVNKGIRHGPPAVMRQLARGEQVDPSAYYFRSTMQFDTAAPAYMWLTTAVFIATAQRCPDHVLIEVYRLE
ncbi:DUF3237 domain-containing protein [Arsenicibacter rosenii]|uniref:UPF0311 protein BLX24_07790 n=1 Tax=Arsenicibacter rosenii TaxID=1750698 RepID=A0A1S2VLW5_9BACT|nr:DUF3237 domain-containing protein [Arsenicibacter rosenii]OIN59752.1 hypothetical protein BLX24_07790 [Arsenicibacter rosenii]